MLAEHLLIGVPTVAAQAMSILTWQSPGQDQEEFLLELFVFYMHILDRMAFGAIGERKRLQFMERLLAVIADALSAPLESAAEAQSFTRQLQGIYNRRQLEYATYKELLPKKISL